MLFLELNTGRVSQKYYTFQILSNGYWLGCQGNLPTSLLKVFVDYNARKRGLMWQVPSQIPYCPYREIVSGISIDKVIVIIIIITIIQHGVARI